MSTAYLPRFLPELLPLEAPDHIRAEADDGTSASHRQALELLACLLELEAIRGEYHRLVKLRPQRAADLLGRDVSNSLYRLEDSLRTGYGSRQHCADADCRARFAFLTGELGQNIFAINDAYSPTPLAATRRQEFGRDPFQSRQGTWMSLDDFDVIGYFTGS